MTALLAPDSGGATTAFDLSRKAFSKPAANLDSRQQAEFFVGNAFFNSAWVAAPSSTSARDGLGPLFNARSCDSCHNNDGRGRPPADASERPISLVIQFGAAAAGVSGGDPVYGSNLNPFAVSGVPAEGTVHIHYREVPGKFADGEGYTLLAPEYTFDELAYGPLAATTAFSPRVAPAVFGTGLLETIPEAQVLERADPDDANGDGVSGRPNRVRSLTLDRIVIGRLGWKANQPDIAHQTAAAFLNEIGMSTSLALRQNCTTAETACSRAPNGGSPEISDEIFNRIVHYEQMLAVPARRDVEAPKVAAGAHIFLASGCESCHRATFTTGTAADRPWLSGKTIHPYSDILLHDMGSLLGDGRVDQQASGSEWRTPPLWGLSRIYTVNGHTRLLHDGRARDVNEAILWHGGEGEHSRRVYLALPKAQREELLSFMQSL